MAPGRKLKRLLVIDTHSDDSAISSGGFLEKFRHCHAYHFVLAACSDISLHHSGSLSRASRLAEYERFVDHFDGAWHRDPDLPFDADSRMDQLPKREVVTALERVISDIEPEVMIVHGPSFHQDHTVVYEAAIAAIRPTARFRPAEIYIAENPTYFHSLGPHTDMRPDFFVSFTRVQMKRKIECFRKCFPSQIRERGNYLSPEGIRSWARYRGIEARCEFAEAFKTFVRVV